MPISGIHAHKQLTFEGHKYIKQPSNDPFSSTNLPTLKVISGMLNKEEGRIKPRTGHNRLPQLGFLKLSDISFPLVANRVSAGYPSDADESLDAPLNLTKYLIREPKTSYYFTATDYSMIEAGIFQNDILVVDCFLEPKHGSIIIALVNGEFTVKQLHKEGDQVKLIPANPDYPTITITKDMSFLIQGVVTSVIHQFKPLN
jgi:DNA polymerase V